MMGGGAGREEEGWIFLVLLGSCGYFWNMHSNLYPKMASQVVLVLRITVCRSFILIYLYFVKYN